MNTPLNIYQRSALLVNQYPNMPEAVIAKAIGDLPEGVTDNTYTRIAVLLEYDGNIPDDIAGPVIGCKPSSISTYRWAYITNGWKDPEVMRAKLNEASRDGKALARENKRKADAKELPFNNIGH